MAHSLESPHFDLAPLASNAAAGCPTPCVLTCRRVLAALVVLTCLGCRAPSPPPQKAAAPAKNGVPDELFDGRAYVELAPHQPALGPATAALTLIVFSDYGCPYCGLLDHRLRELRKSAREDLRVVFVQLPRKHDEQAELAARSALSADRQAKFDPYNRALHARRQKLGDKVMMDLALEVGLDRETFARDLADPARTAEVEADVALAESLAIPGTPSFMLNGELHLGVRSPDELQGLLERERVLVERIVASGIEPDAVGAYISNRIAHANTSSARP